MVKTHTSNHKKIKIEERRNSPTDGSLKDATRGGRMETSLGFSAEKSPKN